MDGAANQVYEVVDQQPGEADRQRGEQPLDEEQSHPGEGQPRRGVVDQPERTREVGEMLEEIAEAVYQRIHGVV